MAGRLTKSEDDKKLFGVAGGIAEHFDLDPTLVRIGFVVLCFCALFLGLVLYVVMAFVMPAAESSPGPAPAADDPDPLDLTSTDPDDRPTGRFLRNALGWGLVGLGIVIAIVKFELLSWSIWVLATGLLCVVGALLLVRRSQASLIEIYGASNQGQRATPKAGQPPRSKRLL